MPKTKEMSFVALRERVMGEVTAEEQGARDGRNNFPADGSLDPAPYQHDMHHRAWEEARDREELARADIKENLTQLRENPYSVPGAGAVERCRAAKSDALGSMDARLHEDHHRLDQAREQRDEKQRVRDHRFLIADAEAPPRGWQDPWRAFNLLAVVYVGDVAVSYGVLRDALGPVKAVVWAVVVPGITMLLGATAGFLTLHPAAKAHRRSTTSYAKRAVAVLLGLGAMTFLYFMSAYRSVLIDGLSGTGAEIWTRAIHEFDKMAQPETLALGLLGLLGFIVSAWKIHAFFGGFVPAVRDADQAAADTQAVLQHERNTVLSYVTEPAQVAMTTLVELLGAVRNWATATAETGDRATARILDHNSDLRDLNNALASGDQAYRRANEIVRTAPPPVWCVTPIVGQELMVPDAIGHARDRALETARAWSATTDAALAELNVAIRDAITFIDQTAGFATVRPIGGGVPALPWRTPQ